MSEKEHYIQLVVTYPQGNQSKIEIKEKKGNIIMTSISPEESYLRIGNKHNPAHVESIIEEFRGRIENYLQEIKKKLTSYEHNKEEMPNLPKNSNYNPLRHW